MSGGSQPSGTTTTTTNQAPWGPQQPYLTGAFAQAQNLFNNGPLQFYPGQTLANISPYQTQAIGMQAQRAQDGSPVVQSADQSISNILNSNPANMPGMSGLDSTANGAYLNANPYLDATYNRAVDPITRAYQTATAPQTDAAFAGAGRYGSGSYNQAVSQNEQNLGRSLSDTATSIYGGNYANERNLQTQAQQAEGNLYTQGVGNQIRGALTAPQLANQDYTDISQLGNAGAQQRQLGQDYINEDMSRFGFNQQAPYNQLGNFEQFIQGNYGGTGSQSTPFFTNPVGNALGIAGGVASLANNVGSFGSNGSGGSGLLGGLGSLWAWGQNQF